MAEKKNIVVRASFVPTGFLTRDVSIPQEEVHAWLKGGDSLEDLVQEHFWDDHYSSDVDEDRGDELEIDSVTVEAAGQETSNFVKA